MRNLAEFQSEMRAALVRGDTGGESALADTPQSARRLQIHMRHYRASLSAALVQRFPCCVWAFGEDLVATAAQAFAGVHPPTVPCIAEYGGGFPEFLGMMNAANLPHWAIGLARLEWHVGIAALAAPGATLEISALAGRSPERLANTQLTLHAGVAHLAVRGPVDELLGQWLEQAKAGPLAAEDRLVCIEVAGDRGSFTLRRLDVGTFAFRSAIVAGSPLGAATEAGLDADPGFDPTAGLIRLFGDWLVAGIANGAHEEAV